MRHVATQVRWPVGDDWGRLNNSAGTHGAQDDRDDRPAPPSRDGGGAGAGNSGSSGAGFGTIALWVPEQEMAVCGQS